MIADLVHGLEHSAPDAVKIVTGDFNRWHVGTVRLMYSTSMNDAFTFIALSPWGSSDHNLALVCWRDIELLCNANHQ